MTTSQDPFGPRARVLGVALQLLVDGLVMTARMMAFRPPFPSAATGGAPLRHRRDVLSS